MDMLESVPNSKSLESQKEEFIKLGVPEKNIRIEVGSAADPIRERPIFYNLIDHELKENDLLLDLPYSNDMAVNQLIATNLAAIAEFETARRRERQRQGIEAAKEKKKYTGRKSVINKDLIKTVEKYKDLGVSVTEIARITGKSRSTIYKVLKEELGYVSNRLIKPEEVHESN